MVGIYKITNKLNKKCYIGQSVHIERRFVEHCMPHSQSIISKAIRNFGKENFSFEILEECNISELDSKEAFWIKYYNSIVPNGYNVADPTQADHTNFIYYNKETLQLILNDILHTSLSFSQIAKKYNVSTSTISRINSGSIHKQENLIYPLRNIVNHINNAKNYCINCHKPITINSTRCWACNGKTLQIPLDKMQVSRDQLKILIRTKSFCEIGRDFQISDNAIRKWCDKFNLPRTKKEIQKYSDAEWELV